MTTWSGPRTTSRSNSSTTEPGRDAATCPAIATRPGFGRRAQPHGGPRGAQRVRRTAVRPAVVALILGACAATRAPTPSSNSPEASRRTPSATALATRAPAERIDPESRHPPIDDIAYPPATRFAPPPPWGQEETFRIPRRGAWSVVLGGCGEFRWSAGLSAIDVGQVSGVESSRATSDDLGPTERRAAGCT